MADVIEPKDGLSPRMTHNRSARHDAVVSAGLAKNSHNGAFIGMTGNFSNTVIGSKARVASSSPRNQKELKK